MYIIVYRYIYILYDILIIYRLIIIYMNTYIFIDVIYIFYLYSRDIYVSISLYNIHKFVYTHVDTLHTHPTRKSPFEGSSALNKGSHTIFLGIVWVCVCGYDKRENYFIPQGGGGISFLSGPHAQS